MKKQLTTCILIALILISPLAFFMQIPQASAVTYNYYMNISGANYQALDSSRNIIYSSTSSSQVFGYLIGSGGVAASGSYIDIEAGAYTVDSTWHIYVNNIYLSFESGAVASAKTNLNTPVMWVHSNNVVINAATINGNSALQTFTGSERIDGVVMSGANDLIQYSTIYDLRCFGVSIDGAGDNSGVINSVISDFGWNGLACYDTNNNFFINNEVRYGGDVGINSYGTNTKITGNYVHDMNGTIGSNNAHLGIACEDDTYTTTGGTGSGNYLFIANNTVVNVNSGIIISSWGTVNINYVMITGNTLTNCDLGYMGAICIDSDYDIVSYNTITTANIGVHVKVFGVASSYNTIYGNTFSGCTANIWDGGTGTIYTSPSIVAVTVTSTPTGAGYITANGLAGYAGTYSTTPFTFYASIGAPIALVANTVVGYTFANWSDSGAQSHWINVPSTNIVYKASYTSGGTGSTTFGTTTIGGSTSSFYTGQPRANQYTANMSGVVTDIKMYITGSGAGRYAKVGIYANSADTPTTLLGESASEEITSDGWHTFSGFAVSVTSGTAYWLACSADNANLLLHYETGGANYWQGDTTTYSYPTFPSPYITFSTMANYNVSIYAEMATSEDTTPPTYSAVTTTTTKAGTSCIFATTINDNVILQPNGQYYFYSNNTGVETQESYGNFTVTPYPAYASIVLNSTVGAVIAYEYNFTDNAGNSNSTGWLYLTTTSEGPTPTPSPTATGVQYPDMLNVQPFWQYLYSGNLLGFFQAIFLYSFLIQDALYGALCMLFLIPIYLRTKNLWLLCVLWILLGSVFVVAIPSLSVLGVLFLALGIGSVFWKMVHPN